METKDPLDFDDLDHLDMPDGMGGEEDRWDPFAPAPHIEPTFVGGDVPQREAVLAALRSIYDPEIPVNIYDLGLIYGVIFQDQGVVKVSMTLTSPNCPAAVILPGEVEDRVGNLPGVDKSEVEIVWDPPWTPDRMTEAAKLDLGML